MSHLRTYLSTYIGRQKSVGQTIAAHIAPQSPQPKRITRFHRASDYWFHGLVVRTDKIATNREEEIKYLRYCSALSSCGHDRPPISAGKRCQSCRVSRRPVGSRPSERKPSIPPRIGEKAASRRIVRRGSCAQPTTSRHRQGGRGRGSAATLPAAPIFHKLGPVEKTDFSCVPIVNGSDHVKLAALVGFEASRICKDILHR